LTLDNYIYGWTALDQPFSRYLINSAIVVWAAPRNVVLVLPCGVRVRGG